MRHFISLGAGVQSSVMALMAARGEITPMPNAAIFADTQAEPRSVYLWLDWLEKQLPFPVYRVTNGSLEDSALKIRTTKDGRKFTKTSIPFHTLNADGSHGMIRHRSCTVDFKILPVQKKARALAKIKRGEKEIKVVQWIGISSDEITRMKMAREPWIENRWPLIELRMRREHCLMWMKKNGFPMPPRSACVFCPYHNNDEWRRLRDEEPQEFLRAIRFEQELQKGKANSQNFASTPFLHRQRVPLSKVDFSTEVDRGQLSLWEDECDGICGM